MIEPGQQLGSYRIQEKIGEGGMGVVYRAYDARLRRSVALKLPSPSVVSQPGGRERFLQEARALAQLRHPLICTVHEVGEDRGQPFLVMELVDGEPLSERIARSPKGLPLPLALGIALQIAEALSEAHSHGVIHRDLKSGNILLRPDGTISVTDFGLAKIVSLESVLSEGPTVAPDLTEPGAAVGTVAYMSPEQARGEPVDARSDVFSLGVILYELTTGRSPFRRATVAASFDALFHAEPSAPSRLLGDAPKGLDRIVAKALEKDAAKRYGSAREMKKDLESLLAAVEGVGPHGRAGRVSARLPWLAVPLALAVIVALLSWWLPSRFHPSSSAEVRSVAVLPFVNLSADPQDEPFADGITEEMISKLASLSTLRVSSRSASFRYKGPAADIERVGRELGVQAVLEGSIRRYGGRLRVTAQLIQVEDGFHLWAADFDRKWKVDDLLGIQEEVATQIASTLNIELSVEDERRLARRATASSEAYELYLRASSQLARGTKAEHMEAIDLLRRAVELDPEFAEAHGRLAVAYVLLVEWGYDFDPGWLAKGEEEARRALALSPDTPVAYEALLILNYHRGLAKEVRDLSKRLLMLEPGNATAHFQLGYMYVLHGFLEEGWRQYELSLESDPFFLPARMNRSSVRDMRGELRAAERIMAKLLDEYPTHPLLTCFLAYYRSGQGRNDEAIALLEPLRGVHPVAQLMLALVYSRKGELEKARKMETPELLRFVRSTVWSWYYLAQVYALQGRNEEAMATIEDALRSGVPYQALEHSPAYSDLRRDPRFRELIERAKQGACAFAEGDENLEASYRRSCGAR